MTEVRILPEIIANKIAAGEVVERPASVVKELVENALDAGAKRISIEIEKGGSDLIRVSDDGHGMSRHNAILSIQRHATSKIVNADDLFSIKTFGFRGEALPSIASVSQFTLITRDVESDSGTKIDISGGKLVGVSEIGAPIGTMIEVKNLYFNTPARRKFLKTVNTEMGHIADSVSAFALCSSHVQFRLIHNGRSVKNFSESDNLLSRVSTVLSVDSYDLYAIDSEPISTKRDLSISGYITKPSVSRNSSNNILLFVNRRIISDRILVSAILKGYKGRLIKGQFPMAAIFIEIPFDQVDVNVHPAKLQVRFVNQSLVFGAVVNAVHNALYHGESNDNSSDEANENMKDYLVNTVISEAPSFSSPLIINRENQHLSIEDTSQDLFEVHEHLLKPKYFSQIEPEYIEEKLRPKTYRQIETKYANKSQKISKLHIIGQFANSYIIAESSDEMVIIDQHAAHERVVYERLKKRSERFRPPSQNLIMPEIVEFSYSEAALLEELIPQLTNLGIEIELFGGRSFIVKSVPAIIDSKSIKSILKDIVGLGEESNFSETDKNNKGNILGNNTTTLWLDNILIVMACHSAVRANHQLNSLQITQLLIDLESCDNPYHCPHGRPTIITFSKKEFEKRFKRDK